MKLSEAVKQYEKCMSQDSGCLVDNCPLHKDMEIDAGCLHDEKGQLTWRIGGCTVMGIFEEWLKRKKPGKPYPDER